MLDLETRVKRIVSDILDRDITLVTNAARLREDLGADSLDYAELAMEFEEALDLPVIDDDRFAKLGTVGDVVVFIGALAVAKAQVA